MERADEGTPPPRARRLALMAVTTGSPRRARRPAAVAAASAWSLAAAVAAAAWPAGGGLAGQEPADTAEADRAPVVVPATGDSAMQARLDSARRMERARRNAVVRSLRPGDRIRVLAGGGTVEGEFLRLAEGHLFLRRGERPADEEAAEGAPAARRNGDLPARADGHPRGDSIAVPEMRQVPVDAMEALWIRLGRTGAGALWGGILGAVGGGVGGYLINEALCAEAEDCIFDGTEAAVVFGLGGGLAGMGFGALIGRGFESWRQWFPEEGSAEVGGG